MIFIVSKKVRKKREGDSQFIQNIAGLIYIHYMVLSYSNTYNLSKIAVLSLSYSSIYLLSIIYLLT